MPVSGAVTWKASDNASEHMPASAAVTWQDDASVKYANAF